MEIRSPTRSVSRHQFSELSLQDAQFNPHSQYLLPLPKNQSSLECTLSFQGAFRTIRDGFLEKKTMNSSWQYRFFVLTPVRLLYFSDIKMTQLKGCFNLASLSQYDLHLKGSFPELSLLAFVALDKQIQQKTLLVLQIQDKAEFNGWKQALQGTIKDLQQGKMQIRTFPKLIPEQVLETNRKIGSINCNFWNRLNISAQQLISYASHLDVIFLRSRSTFSCLHRFFMRSRYDHVGILLKDEAGRPYLLEAVDSKGVTISPLESLLQSFQEEYEQLGYRKLIVSAGSQLKLEKLQEYINSIIGKKYELSLSKLLIGNETEDDEPVKEEEKTKQIQTPERTFFCSELIADIYLKFGVLPKGKSTNYWPKDFQDSELMLKDGFRLSPLMQVEVQRKSDHDLSTLEQ